ncbi:hypothetical protein ACHAWF_005671 [Thalassiosira exigua]
MMTRRCNRLLVLPLVRSTATLSAAIAVGANGASFAWRPPSHTSSLSSPPPLTPRLRPGPQCSPRANRNDDPSWRFQRRRFALGSHSRSDEDCGGVHSIEKVISSVRESLRRDIVEPHINALSDSSKTGTNRAPTLVLVLAVSGGCDSIALFHSILSLYELNGPVEDPSVDATNQDTKCWLHLEEEDALERVNLLKVPCELHVAHFNHEQRGESSDGDESFVRNLCEQNGVTFHSYSWSEENTALREFDRMVADDDCNDEIVSGSFTQDVARKWRRRKLQELLANVVLRGYDSSSSSQGRWGAILTAHHRDDADETILLKLLRGSHLTNIRGMDAISDAFDLMESQRAEGEGSHIYTDIQSTSLGYFAKPLLRIRKHDIINYLESNSLEWREDQSNASSKYKRNKVRNELIPLLSEISGGEHALQKRLRNLEQQSRDLSNDVSERALSYLQTMPSEVAFLLPMDSAVEFGLVHEEALHMWLLKVSNRKLQLTYDQMLRIRDQIHKYPERMKWTLDVGNHCRIERNGRALSLSGRENDCPADASNSRKGDIPWTAVLRDDANNSGGQPPERLAGVHELCFCPLPGVSHSSLKLERVRELGNPKLRPPWRQRALKIKEILRGQKVPLHRRDEAIVLCANDNSTQHALALYVEGTGDGSGKWIANADFSPQDGLPVTRLLLLHK